MASSRRRRGRRRPAAGDPLRGAASIATAERVAETPRGLVAVGLDGDAFGAWTLSEDTWSSPMSFGHRDPGAREAAYIVSLASVRSEVAVAYSDGAHFRLALGPAGGPWPDVAAPVSIPVTGDGQLAVAGGGGRLLLVGDDGSEGRVWVGEAPGG